MTEIKTEGQLRAAGYGRCAAQLQGTTSTEDQFRRLHLFAAQKGWTMNYLVSDEGCSGTTLTDRPALQSLIDIAKKCPRPYDVLLVDDPSRLGRNLTLVLSIVEELNSCGIFTYFVNQQLDSHDQSGQQLLATGMLEEQFLVRLKGRVRRGQDCQSLNDALPKCYGFTNVPIEDSVRNCECGDPVVVGVKREIHPEEADRVRRIFDLYGSERLSLLALVKRVNEE